MRRDARREESGKERVCRGRAGRASSSRGRPAARIDRLIRPLVRVACFGRWFPPPVLAAGFSRPSVLPRTSQRAEADPSFQTDGLRAGVSGPLAPPALTRPRRPCLAPPRRPQRSRPGAGRGGRRRGSAEPEPRPRREPGVLGARGGPEAAPAPRHRSLDRTAHRSLDHIISDTTEPRSPLLDQRDGGTKWPP